jgi:NTP pyrophosphatase (non-canonical NTP hydrolase)
MEILLWCNAIESWGTQMEIFTLRSIQDYIKQKDFQPESKQAYFLKLIEEVGELSEAVRKNKRMTETGTIKGTIEEELYDVLYYVLALANLYEIDMEMAMRLKEEINKRKYET